MFHIGTHYKTEVKLIDGIYQQEISPILDGKDTNTKNILLKALNTHYYNNKETHGGYTFNTGFIIVQIKNPKELSEYLEALENTAVKALEFHKLDDKQKDEKVKEFIGQL